MMRDSDVKEALMKEGKRYEEALRHWSSRATLYD
jgi:hypothetical protein